MSDSATLIRIARSDAFSGRVAFLAIKTAVSVANEDAATPDHAARVKFANLVLRGELNNKLFAGTVLTNPTIAQTAIADQSDDGAAVPDGDIEFQMASVWTAMGKAQP